MTPDSITLHAGIVSVNGRPLLRFGSSAQAAVCLSAHGWHLQARNEETYRFAR